MSTRKITVISMLTALVYVGRVAFQIIPNVQPVTTILFLITIVYGFKDGVIVATLSIIMSNINLGMGIWTIPQIVSYVLVVAIASRLAYFHGRASKFVMATYCFQLGIMYGFFISVAQIPLFGANIFLQYYMAGIPFDLYHAFGNFVFYMLLSPVLIPLMEKNRRLTSQWG